MALKTELVTSLSYEIVLQRDFLSKKELQTIYFGGGTPSILDEYDFQLMFETIRKEFDISNNCEITIEANPEDITFQKLETFKKAGINRLSIGIQTFDDSKLKWMNRNHSSKDSKNCIELAQKFGFENINLDLIYGIPNSDLDFLDKDLVQLIEFKPKHISAYCFTIEQNTVFGKRKDKGALLDLDEDQSFRQFEFLIEKLSQNGFEQYEISNFSKPEFKSKHNSNYWEGKEYLGIGPSAHSYKENTRYFNVSNNSKYINSIQKKEIPVTTETLNDESIINEYLMTNLRKSNGINLIDLKNIHQYDLINERKKEIENCLKSNCIQLDNNDLILTTKGKFLSNTVISMLFK